MKAQLKFLNSPEVCDLEGYRPGRRRLCIFIEMLVGPVGIEGGYETFSFTLCTPKWLMNNKQKGGRLRSQFWDGFFLE